MRSLLLRVLGFLALTIPLTWVWVHWAQEGYAELLAALVGPLLGGAPELAESPAAKRFVNYVPFLALLLVTPGLSLRRRIAGLAAGCAVLFGAHVGLAAVEAWSRTPDRPTEDAFSTLFPAAMLADALPFILWAVIAHRVLRNAFATALAATGWLEGGTEGDRKEAAARRPTRSEAQPSEGGPLQSKEAAARRPTRSEAQPSEGPDPERDR